MEKSETEKPFEKFPRLLGFRSDGLLIQEPSSLDSFNTVFQMNCRAELGSPL